MNRRTNVLLGAALALAFPLSASAADSDLQQLRRELHQMKSLYEARINALERRVAIAENQVERAREKADRAETARPVGESAFNPGVSLILSGTYGSSSADVPERHITGFMPAAGHNHGGFEKGFSLGESELVMSASIDPHFRGFATVALTPDNTVEVEEAAVETTALGHGFTLKGGRFYSAVGYLNEQHPHAWDFVDAPLAYQAFLNGNYSQDGLQAKWVAPTDLFLELGVEAGRGERFPGAGGSKNGPGAVALFAHLGGDVGTSHAWRAGLSLLRHDVRGRLSHAEDVTATEVENAFTGTSKTWVADFVWKWAPEGNASVRNFKLQGEYFRRRENGDLTYDVNANSAGPLTDGYRSAQSGWYLQGVYQFMPRWRVGLRHDRLDPGTVDYAANDANLERPGYRPNRSSLMVDYSPSEYSRVRLQFNRDRAMQNVADNQVMLQYIMSLGSHGAHKF